MHQARIDQLLDKALPQPFDVHRAPAGEMQQGLLALRRAEEAAAAAGHGSLLALDDRGMTDGAFGGELKNFRVRRPHFDPYRDHLGDHVASAAHDHGIADAHVLALELVFVMQGRVRHRDPADEHRLELRHRRQSTGAADLHLDGEHLGGLFLPRETYPSRSCQSRRLTL